MSLSDIAAILRAAARQEGHVERSPLPNGAQLTLDCNLKDRLANFTLRITRQGSAPVPGSRGDKARQTEIRTFAKYFVPPGVAHTSTGVPAAERGTYCTVIEWTEPDQATRASALPKDDAEIRAWAQTLGPGIRITGVNVDTGEI